MRQRLRDPVLAEPPPDDFEAVGQLAGGDVALAGGSREGHWQTIATALKPGTAVGLRARRGHDKCYLHEDATLLHLAAWGGQAEVCARLLERGAVVDARSERGETPLLYAATSRAPSTFDVVTVLLDHGAAPDAVDAVEERSALHSLAVQGNTRSLALLLRRGASAKVVTTRSSSTPLHYAAEGGQQDAASLLLDAAVDPAHRDDLG